MTIQAYVGLPGSGKSYNAVAQTIIPALRESRVVVTNIPLNKPAILELFPLADIREFPIDEVAQQPARIFDHVQPGVVWVVDELWKLFPAGQTVKHVPAEYKTLLAEHRHRLDESGNAISIVFVTQDLAQIGAFARQLVETTIVHTKLSHLGASKSFRASIYHGSQTGQSPPQSAKINQVLGRYDPKIFKLYTSHTMSEAQSGNINESSLDARANIWRRPGLWAAGGACLIAVWWGLSTLGDIFGSDEPPLTDIKPSKTATAPAQSSSSTFRKSPVASTSVVKWRVAAFVKIGDSAFAVLQDDQGDSIRIDGAACEEINYRFGCSYGGEFLPFRSAPHHPGQPSPTPVLAL